eukprot:GEMP01044166.1.p1 GENE.GEMP01044166.1~~GEMP01044166.1.p1  ORF type:complete len:468 (+),score=89.04 GEMP01044166.1:130-1533(+)
MPLCGLLHVMDSISGTHADELLAASPLPFAVHGFHAKHAITSFLGEKTVTTLFRVAEKDFPLVSPETPPLQGSKEPGSAPQETLSAPKSKQAGSAFPVTPPLQGSKEPGSAPPGTPTGAGSNEPGPAPQTTPVPGSDQLVNAPNVPPVGGGVQKQGASPDVPDGEPRSFVVDDNDILGKVQIRVPQTKEQLEFGLKKCSCPDSEGKLPTGSNPPIASFSVAWVGPDKKTHVNLSDCLCANDMGHNKLSGDDIQALNANMDGRIGSVHWGQPPSDTQANVTSTSTHKESVTTMAVCVKGVREGGDRVPNCDKSAVDNGIYGSGEMTIKSPVKLTGVPSDEDAHTHTDTVVLCKCNDIDVTKPEGAAANPLPSPIDAKPQTLKAGRAPAAPQGPSGDKVTSDGPQEGNPAPAPLDGKPESVPHDGKQESAPHEGKPGSASQNGKPGSPLQQGALSGEAPNDKAPKQNMV